MVGLWVTIGLLICWISYVIFLACRCFYNQKRRDKALVYLKIGSQGDIAEWLLKKIFGIDGISSGRLSLVLEVEDAKDDTKKIADIYLRKKDFVIVSQSRGQKVEGQNPTDKYYDLRGLNSRKLLESYLDSISAL